MTDQPTTRPTPLDDRLLSAILDEDERTFRVLSHAARHHAARMAHPAGRGIATQFTTANRAGYVPLVAPPLPDCSRIGPAITAYAAVLLIVAGFLVGVTQHFAVAIGFVTLGCALAGRLAHVHYRTGEKS